MNVSLSRFSILQQILIGYIPVLLILFFLAFSSFSNFQKFSQSFNQLQEITKEKLTFLEVERDVVELQRNVLVYSYVGYRGVLKKIEFLQKNLEQKFSIIEPIAQQDAEIEARFMRMLDHYNDYKKGFEEAVREKAHLSDLSTNRMKPLIEQSQKNLGQAQNILIRQKNFEAALQVSRIQQSLSRSNSNVDAFKKSPDSLLIKDTRALISKMEEQKVLLENSIEGASSVSENLRDFSKALDIYKNLFKETIHVNRTYLHLINVVLAGKAAEIDKLANELDELIALRSQILSSSIDLSIQKARNQFVVLSVLAGIIGFLSSIFIAMGIAKPVRRMAMTLSRLAKGEADTKIPGQQRSDEVGQMAIAADEFKVMAKSLELQTAELEEFSYRTSHDLRSPLISSIGLLDISVSAIETGDNEKAKKSLRLVKSSLSGLEVLVKDILELTKTKNVQEDLQVIDFEEIVNKSLQRLSNMNNFERLDIKKSLNDDGKLFSQKSRIELIVGNFISNAIKYQDIEKQSSFLKISTCLHNNTLVFEAEDNGLGIPERQRENLFEMFKRFHTKVSYGSGLGLYMIKKSADVIGGSVVYEPKVDGSIFKLIIPKTTDMSGVANEN